MKKKKETNNLAECPHCKEKSLVKDLNLYECKSCNYKVKVHNLNFKLGSKCLICEQHSVFADLCCICGSSYMIPT